MEAGATPTQAPEMITDPPQMPPPVIATALNDPLALTAPAARRSSSSNSSSTGGCDGSGGSGVAGASGSSGRAPSPPRFSAPEASNNNDDEDAGEAAAKALAALLVANQATAEAAAAALAERLAMPSMPPRPPEPERDPSVQPSPASGPAAPAASPSICRGRPYSLQDICCMVIMRHISVHNCLELFGALQGHTAPALEIIAAASLKYLVNSFETLQGLRTEEELRAVLPAELYDSLVSAQEERANAVAEMRRVGRAVERQAPPEDLGPVQVPSVTGRPISYPHEALKPGLIWPEGVQASDRETWLSEADFRLLFKGLSWEEFCKLPAWKKTGYKQDAGMF
ncbi:hypothetical protein PLESTM_001483200 [Pleodorina starrii]|nr:hypothetical protein PLESTM_001483200 [Pleodorina starrii]